MERSADAVVIGLGALGSAAAYRAATAPGSPTVVGLEHVAVSHAECEPSALRTD